MINFFQTRIEGIGVDKESLVSTANLFPHLVIREFVDNTSSHAIAPVWNHTGKYMQ